MDNEQWAMGVGCWVMGDGRLVMGDGGVMGLGSGTLHAEHQHLTKAASEVQGKRCRMISSPSVEFPVVRS